MRGYTPGPWVVWKDKSGRLSVGSALGSTQAIAAISPIYGQSANSRLIAAAPDLLEALELMVSTHEEGGWPTATIVVARAAIAKAKGEQP